VYGEKSIVQEAPPLGCKLFWVFDSGPFLLPMHC